MTYIELFAEEIKKLVPVDLLPDGDTRVLFLIYAAVGLAKGESVSREDVHNAWAAWMVASDPSHESIKPFDQLDPDTKSEDDPFVVAIRSAFASWRSSGQ